MRLAACCLALEASIARRMVSLDAGDRLVLVEAENLLGHLEQASGNGHAARDRFCRSLDGFGELDIPWGTGLVGLAGVELALGENSQAVRLLDEATSVLQQAGPWARNHPLYIRVMLAVRRQEPEDAIALVRETLELHDKVGSSMRWCRSRRRPSTGTMRSAILRRSWSSVAQTIEGGATPDRTKTRCRRPPRRPSLA